MHPTWKTNWPESRQRYLDWWQGKGTLLSMWGHLPKAGEPHETAVAPPSPAGPEQAWFDVTHRAARLHHDLSRSSFAADILPVADTNLGPGSLAAILGAEVGCSADSVWFDPPESFDGTIRFDPENRWWKLHCDLLRACKEKAQGRYWVGMPDLIEGLDILASLLGTQEMMMNAVTEPEQLEEQLGQLLQIWFQVFDELYEIIQVDGEMAFCCFSLWAPGRVAKLQCDCSIMISEEMFRQFCLPTLTRQCEWLDCSLYHLDGVGAIRHLDAILEVEELNAIQWTPGAGEPQGGDPKWFDLYRKIRAAGKSVMPVFVTLDELRPLLDAVGPDGLHLLMDFKTEVDIEAAEAVLEEYR